MHGTGGTVRQTRRRRFPAPRQVTDMTLNTERADKGRKLPPEVPEHPLDGPIPTD